MAWQHLLFQHLLFQWTSALFVLLGILAAVVDGADEPPREWIESETGHRVVRLSTEPGSCSLYFHQYPFSADGKKMVFTTDRGLASVDLDTRAVTDLVDGPVNVLVTGRKTGDVYYIREGAVHAVSLDTHESRLVAKLPEAYRWQFDAGRLRQFLKGQATRDGNVGDPAEIRLDGEQASAARQKIFGWGNVTVNCDETLLVGIGYDPDGKPEPRTPPPGQSPGWRLGPRWTAGDPQLLFTIDTSTGETKVIHRSNDWLNHLQCSPTDPTQILFCHEGPWHFVDRTWLIRTDGSRLTQVHPRTMDMEIGGHEYFSPDGKQVIYDLQTPRSLVFWLASYDIQSGARIWYHLERQEWSVHYNSSPDLNLFSGDGGGNSSVANLSPNFELLDPPANGKWMYLFRPELIRKTGLPEQAAKQVKVGVLRSERLVDLSNHDYSLEPNGIFTPDGRWLVFRSNMHGAAHVYAVEIEKNTAVN